MSTFEVPNPILNSPFEEPKEHWWIVEGESPELRQGRRPAMYYYFEPGRDQNDRSGVYIELKRVNLIRERVRKWREQGWPRYRPSPWSPDAFHRRSRSKAFTPRTRDD
jgi:type III restriction enzyme